jgi:ankyrin repeat protein
LVHGEDSSRSTALLLAVEAGSREVAHHLIKLGADVNHCNRNRLFPLHVACAVGSLHIVKLLIRVRQILLIEIYFALLHFDLCTT